MIKLPKPGLARLVDVPRNGLEHDHTAKNQYLIIESFNACGGIFLLELFSCGSPDKHRVLEFLQPRSALLDHTVSLYVCVWEQRDPEKVLRTWLKHSCKIVKWIMFTLRFQTKRRIGFQLHESQRKLSLGKKGNLEGEKRVILCLLTENFTPNPIPICSKTLGRNYRRNPFQKRHGKVIDKMGRRAARNARVGEREPGFQPIEEPRILFFKPHSKSGGTDDMLPPLVHPPLSNESRWHAT